MTSQLAREPGEILSAGDVARLHPGDTDFQLSKLCDSHEALRAALSRAEARLAEMERELANCRYAYESLANPGVR